MTCTTLQRLVQALSTTPCFVSNFETAHILTEQCDEIGDSSRRGFSGRLSPKIATLIQRRGAGRGCPLVSMSPGVGLRPPPPPLLTTKGHPHPAPRSTRWFATYRSRASSALQRPVIGDTPDPWRRPVAGGLL